MSLLDVLTKYRKDPSLAAGPASLLPDAEALDRSDPLRHKRDEFLLPAQSVYLDGNSLGPMPVAARQRAQAVLDQQWGEDLICSWNKHSWIDLPQTVGDKIAPMLGAAPGQVICCDSVSINLFKVLSAALGLNPGRRKIVSQRDNFPTDLYVVQGLQQLLGETQCELEVLPEEEIEGALDDQVAVLLLTQVNFRSGYAHDIARLTRAAQAHGALVIWDLAHSTGVMPLELDHWNVDFAVGCGYKYLNGGPGAPAFVYAARRHHAALRQPVAGWMGHQSPFEFSPEYTPAGDIRQFLAGTPPILSMSVLDAALDVYRDVDIRQVKQKALNLADYFAARMMELPSLQSLELATPLAHIERGAQLAYVHPQAFAICQCLIAEGVIADFRAPNILRFGFSPLYLSFCGLDKALERFAAIMEKKLYALPEFNVRKKVT
ncbi:kynureninase [Microbulbifer sp. Q7]|uniref:kynureninase n=1 Tax=Microbulbifer sp. Q7 TaxID=1785091 RepID=UPI0009EE8EC8|nr:kynureninase [Microbulbifer sp. Q7]